MATLASLISKIHSLLHYTHSSLGDKPYSVDTMSMGLRNLNVHLVFLRNLGGDDIQSLFSRIEDAIGRASIADLDDTSAVFDIARALNCLAQECEQYMINTISNRLTLDDVVEVVDFLIDIAEFRDVLERCWFEIPNLDTLTELMDEFEVHTKFLRDFLLFAKRIVVDTSQQLQNLLIHVSPFVQAAASMFMEGGTSFMGRADWIKQVGSKYPWMDPQVFQSYSKTLLSISTLDQKMMVCCRISSALISLLWHHLRYHLDSLKKTLYECLRLSRFNLKQGRQCNNDNFGDQIGVLIRDAGVVICSFYHTYVINQISVSNLIQRFDVVQPQLLPESNSLRESVPDFGDSTTM